MAYTLTSAVAHLTGIPWLTRQVENELVEGFFNGANTAFRVASPPLATADSLTLAGETGGVLYQVVSVNVETGGFVVTPAPSVPITANYTASLLSETKLQWICRKGLDEMESRWRRDYVWVLKSGVYNISSDPLLVVDPVTGGKTFSTSRAQLEFYHTCCELILLRTLAQEAAYNSIYYREERVGGLSVDATRRARDWNVLLEGVVESLKDKESQARAESGNVDDFGFFLPGPRKVDGVWVEFGEEEESY